MFKEVFLNRKHGFMLYEMIISVFIISVCSGFLLQLFLYSKTLNAKANDIDNSTIILLNSLELSKNYPTLNKYFKDEFFDGATINTIIANEKFNILKYYDEDWNTVYNDLDDVPSDDDIKYVLELDINDMESNSKKAILTFKQDAVYATTYGNSAGLKYNIDGKVYYLENPNDVLIQMDTTSYFGNNIQ